MRLFSFLWGLMQLCARGGFILLLSCLIPDIITDASFADALERPLLYSSLNSITMAIDSARAFLDKITSDDNFRSRLVSEMARKRTELVREAGFDFTEDELEEAKSSLSPGALGHVAGWFCDVEKEDQTVFRGRRCGGGLWH